MRLLAQAVGQVLRERPTEGAPREALTSDEVAGIEAALTPETVLLTYTLDGETQTFDALDFYAWLPELKYGELQGRPAAAVGRALRNEVFAQRGLAMGLDEDPRVEEAVAFYTGNFLANRLREELQATERVEPTDDQVHEAYERLGYRRLERVEADYWQIAFSTREAAQNALRRIEAGERVPQSYETYVHASALAVPDDDIGALVRRAPVATPRMACSEGTCYVLQVDDRTMHYTPLEDVEGAIRERLAAILPEVELVSSLRADADVEVDTALFEQMMELPAHRPSDLIADDDAPAPVH